MLQTLNRTKQGGVSAHDAVAVQQGVVALAKLFEVDVPKKAEPAKAVSEAPPQKSIADVMDKAIDKVSDVVGAMAQAIKNIAPDVWRIMITQQYAKAVASLVVPLLLVAVCIGAFFASRARHMYCIVANADKANPENINSDEIGFFWAVRVVSALGICMSCIWLANRISESALFLINPEFYAIQDLLRMILNRGM